MIHVTLSFSFRISKLKRCLIHFVRFLEISGLIFTWNLSKFFFSIIKNKRKKVSDSSRLGLFTSTGFSLVGWVIARTSSQSNCALFESIVKCTVEDVWNPLRYIREINWFITRSHQSEILKKKIRKKYLKDHKYFLNSEKKEKNRKWIKTDGTKRLKMVKE